MADTDFVKLPESTEVGSTATGASTRYFLECQDMTPGRRHDWWLTGRHMEEGHETEGAARAEFTDDTARDKYINHRIVRVDTTVTLTVVGQYGPHD